VRGCVQTRWCHAGLDQSISQVLSLSDQDFVTCCGLLGSLNCLSTRWKGWEVLCFTLMKGFLLDMLVMPSWDAIVVERSAQWRDIKESYVCHFAGSTHQHACDALVRKAEPDLRGRVHGQRQDMPMWSAAVPLVSAP
jgi:hypothetical protein